MLCSPLVRGIVIENSSSDRYYMEIALQEARIAAASGEIPVGAVVVLNGELIAQAHNRREELQSPLAHAEALAIELAAKRMKSWRLEESLLYVTMEPCIMCVGAILQARIERLVFGCWDAKAGAVESLHRLCEDTRLNHRLPWTGGVLEKECGAVLTEFFAELRKKSHPLASKPEGSGRDN